jgi:hypothetical protein
VFLIDFWTLNCELKNYKITGIYIVETLLLLLIKLDYSNSIVLHKYTISEWVIVTFIYINFQWNDDKVRFVLYQHAELDLYSASSLKQQSVDIHVTPLVLIILIPSQPVFALSP